MTLRAEERRKHQRFTDQTLADTHILLVPVTPLGGEPTTGSLVNLSAGGMALRTTEALPKNGEFKMTVIFPDGAKFEMVAVVRHISQQRDEAGFVHGIEFLSPADDMVQRIQTMGLDCAACDERISSNLSRACLDNCSLVDFCTRPQRRTWPDNFSATDYVDRNPPPVRESWADFKARFKSNLSNWS